MWQRRFLLASLYETETEAFVTTTQGRVCEREREREREERGGCGGGVPRRLLNFKFAFSTRLVASTRPDLEGSHVEIKIIKKLSFFYSTTLYLCQLHTTIQRIQFTRPSEACHRDLNTKTPLQKKKNKI